VITTGLRTGQPTNRRSIPVVSRDGARLRCVQTDPGAQPDIYSMDNRGAVPWGKGDEV
jgi:hypothetical protein